MIIGELIGKIDDHHAPDRPLVSGLLGQFGLRAIPFGIAAMVLGFILKSAGTQAERLEGSGDP